MLEYLFQIYTFDMRYNVVNIKDIVKKAAKIKT